jgi:cytochrome c551/c552
MSSSPVSQERAERIARSHACVRCAEYSWKRVKLRLADAAAREAHGAVWQAELVCGVCDTWQEIGIAADGDIVYAG